MIKPVDLKTTVIDLSNESIRNLDTRLLSDMQKKTDELVSKINPEKISGYAIEPDGLFDNTYRILDLTREDIFKDNFLSGEFSKDKVCKVYEKDLIIIHDNDCSGNYEMSSERVYIGGKLILSSHSFKSYDKTSTPDNSETYLAFGTDISEKTYNDLRRHIVSLDLNKVDLSHKFTYGIDTLDREEI